MDGQPGKPPAARHRAWLEAAWRLYVAALIALLWAPMPARPPAFPGADKVFHAVAFAVATVLCRAAGRGSAWALWFGAALALVTEGGQAVVDDWFWRPLGWPPAERTPEVADALADLAGAAVGLGVVRWALRARMRRNGRDSNPR